MRRWGGLTGRSFRRPEQSLVLISHQPRPKLVDATHETTGKTVYIKEVSTDSEELRIAELLMQKEWIGDPRNHCVPVTKVFKDHQNTEISYVVMPFLRPVDSPPFEYVKEIIEFTDQILEVTVDRSPTPIANPSVSRAWYSSMRKGWHTGTVYFPGLRSLNDHRAQRLRPGQPYDGCRSDVS